MNFMRNRFVRFEDWHADRPSSSERQFANEDGLYPRRPRKTVSSVLKSIWREVESGSRRVTSLGKSLSFAEELGSRKKILDPLEPFLQRWNKVFVLSWVIAVSLDPFFFYVPVINGKKKCLTVDKTLAIAACILRSFTDLFYLLHIVFQFRTGFISPSSRVFGRGELIEDQSAIVRRYLSSTFIIDILSLLPLPQVALLVIIPNLRGPAGKNLLKYIVFSQYVPRLVRFYPLYKEVTSTSGILTETAWAGAAFNLFLYMLASHAVGACWYLISIERQLRCWQDACRELKCDDRYLYCGEQHTGNNAILNASCRLIKPDEIRSSTVFDFGIFLDALRSGVVESGDFAQKFSYCFWWGLRNVSSLGQNLNTSTFVGEILFAVFISIFGLVLFSLLIGNIQKYLQSTTIRIEEMRVKRQDVEHWMSHRMLPENLRERIRRYEHYKWQETRGVEEESLIRNLPKDLRRDIKRHLCLDLLMTVPMFEKMDERLLEAMCDRLKPVLYTEKSFIIREGDPVDEMLLIMRGKLLTTTTYGGKTGFFNSVYIKANDFCGEELFTWALDPNSSSNLPTSTRTVEALTEVEAFALMADDLKFVASQFRRLHSEMLRHTFRFYSQQWRAWAARFIQGAWCRYHKRKLRKFLREGEDRLQDALAKEAQTSSSLGATIYASRFAINALRTLPRSGAKNANWPQRLLPILPQKPAEPDFTTVEDGY